MRVQDSDSRSAVGPMRVGLLLIAVKHTRVTTVVVRPEAVRSLFHTTIARIPVRVAPALLRRSTDNTVPLRASNDLGQFVAGDRLDCPSEDAHRDVVISSIAVTYLHASVLHAQWS